MLKTKKILSVVLSVLMLFSIFAFSSTALVADKPFGIVLKANTNEIKQGDTITVTMYFEIADWSQLMSDMRLAILYDSNVYTPDTTSQQFLGDLLEYAKEANQPRVNAAFGSTVMSTSSLTAEERASYTSALMQQIGADAQKGQTAKAGFSVTEESDGLSVAQWSMDFQVTGDPNAGNKNIAVCDSVAANGQYIKQTTGSATPTLISGLDASKGNILANMEQQPAGPVVSKNAAQVKMTLNDEKTAPVISAANPFSLRVISEISEEDWNSYFEPTVVDGKVTTNIKRVGIVGYKGDGTFDMATAVEVAKGADVADYQAADTTYIQKKDGESAKFGARIDFKAQGNIKDVTYVAFVEYGNGEYAFYAEPATAKLLTNYETIVNSYIGFVNK